MDRLAIKILVGHCLGGVGNDVKVGKILIAPDDLTFPEALRKVHIGYACIVPEPAPKSSAPTIQAPRPITPAIHRDPFVQNGEPTIEEHARRGRRVQKEETER